MSAAERVVAIIQEQVRNDRMTRIAFEWPSLAAALGDLCEEQGAYVPAPLRRAQRAERGLPVRPRPGRLSPPPEELLDHPSLSRDPFDNSDPFEE